MDEVCSFLFRRSGRRSFLGAAPAAQFHAGPSGGQKAAGARRGRLVGLEGLARGASMCQAAIRSLRATDDFAGFLPWRARDPQVVAVPGVGRPPGLVGRLDRRPAKRPASRPWRGRRSRALPRLAHPRRQAGVADQLARGSKPRDLADLGGEGEAEQRPDARASSPAASPARPLAPADRARGRAA